jgi:hypothetical protein
MSGRELFRNSVLIIFLLTQYLDGVFTYYGVSTMGIGMEANPLMIYLIQMFGLKGIVFAKLATMLLGIFIFIHKKHGMLVKLSIVYIVFAIIPWIIVIF